MGIADLGNVLKIFGGSDISEEEQQALFQEVLLMVLARASLGTTMTAVAGNASCAP